MAFALTQSQQAAVDYRGSALLVSAAAGSGKTRVLVERLLSYILEGYDIDSFLIITYTRAAAAELKSRIVSELNELVAKSPENARLRRQATLCYRAQIGTIHSFCTTVLRENAHLAGVTPDFSVLEEDRAETVKARVMEKLMDRHYEHIEDEPGFRALTDTVGAGRDDTRLTGVLMQLHTKLMSHAWPEKWAEEQKKNLNVSGISDAGETVWGRELLDAGRKTAEYWRDRTEELIQSVASGDEAAQLVWKAYGDSLSETAEGLRDLCRRFRSGWDDVGKTEVTFPRLGVLRKPPADAAAIAEKVKSLRDSCKKAMEKLKKQFATPSEKLLSDMEYMRPAMEALLDLALEFDRAYTAEKHRLGVADFTDLEHLALRLLYDGEKNCPSELAESISAKYTEIMVDEYQDVNAVQNLIFSSVSRSGKNLFMVGDVKQSIYRFRLADPTIFLRRYEESEEYSPEKRSESSTIRILLKENFRSRAGVLNAANHVFANIMSPELGEMEYDDDAALVAGAKFTGEDPAVTMTVLEVGGIDAGDDGETPGKTALEAEYVAGEIKKLVESGAKVFDGGESRPMRYSDIVILLRSPGGSGAEYRRALIEAGIPAETDQGSEFFSEPEVASALSLLAVIDNPRQDVALISAMRSPCFGFTADELAEIRACDKDHDFYTALCAAAKTTEKVRSFLELLESMRELAPDMSIDSLLRLIYDRTGMLTVVSAMADGESRRENLMLLLEYAGRFEENGYRGLFMFNQWMKRLISQGNSPATVSPESSAVKIMSIHKSKGLEFPVVFLCDTERRFNKRDTASAVLVHTDLGLGPKYTDTERAVEWPTLPRRAIAKRMLKEMLSEEMRVLYVAMTRAKEYLFITCAMKNAEKNIDKMRGDKRGPIAPQLLEGAKSMAGWIISAALLEDSPIELRVVYATDERAGENAEIQPESGADEAEAEVAVSEEFRSAMEFSYPYAWAEALPSKLTATAVKETGIQESEEPGESVLPTETGFSPEFRRPELGTGRKLTAAQKGTATHLFMQYADFRRASAGRDAVRGEIERLTGLGILSREEGKAVDERMVSAFFRSDIGKRVLACEKPMREFRFSLLCDADEYYKVPAGEKLMLQGVVDCAIEENGSLTVIDYKTDAVFSDEDIEARAEYYSPQVDTYAMAMERVTGKPVRQTVLYFLRPGRAVIRNR